MRKLSARTKILLLVATLFAVVAVALQVTHRHTVDSIVTTSTDKLTDQSATPEFATLQSIVELGRLLNENYHSTNSHDAITSALAHQLVAERLRTNTAFLDWASNVTKSIIVHFIENGNIPIYGTKGLTAEMLRLEKVGVNGMVGMSSEAVFDPNPTNEGPLAFIVEGGIHPTIVRVENGFRLISYQLQPDYWSKGPRRIGRMDWSCAVQPLDKDHLGALARHAFKEMTSLDLDSFQLEKSEITIQPIRNPTLLHPEVTITGNPNAKLYSVKDSLSPFAEFRYDDTSPAHPVHVAFSGEMVQTSPGHGEFVRLFAVLRKTEAIFELGEKFLGQGTWESNMLHEVNSMNTEQRGQVYRRIFAH